jgi:hypothetical protein
MIDRDSLEFTTALALGAALGAGLTLLIRPEDSARRRIERRTRPSRRRIAREMADLRTHAAAGAAGVGRVGREARGLGSQLRGILREEGAALLRESGRELIRVLIRRGPGGAEGRNGKEE